MAFPCWNWWHHGSDQCFEHLLINFGSSPNIVTLILTSPKVPPKDITPTSTLVDVDLFDDHDNIMTKIAVNLEHKEVENTKLAQQFDDKENHPTKPPRLQTLVQKHLNNAPVNQRMNGLQVISDNEAQDCAPKPSELIINIPTEKPNVKEKQLSLDIFLVPLQHILDWQRKLYLFIQMTKSKQLVERGKTNGLQMTF